MSEQEEKIDTGHPLNYRVPQFNFREANDVNRFTVPGFNYAEDTKGLVKYFRDKQAMNANHQMLIDKMSENYNKNQFGEFQKKEED